MAKSSDLLLSPFLSKIIVKLISFFLKKKLHALLQPKVVGNVDGSDKTDEKKALYIFFKYK